MVDEVQENVGVDTITEVFNPKLNGMVCIFNLLLFVHLSGTLHGKMLDLGLLEISLGYFFPISSPYGGL